MAQLEIVNDFLLGRVPLERNFTSYIWNGTFETTGFSYVKPHAIGFNRNYFYWEENACR